MKYTISNQGDPYVFPVTTDHVFFWHKILHSLEPPKSAGFVNIKPDPVIHGLCKLEVVSGSDSLGIPRTKERDCEDLQRLTDYLTCL